MTTSPLQIDKSARRNQYKLSLSSAELSSYLINLCDQLLTISAGLSSHLIKIEQYIFPKLYSSVLVGYSMMFNYSPVK